MRRDVLLLDLDGTLVDSVPDLMASLNRLMLRRGLAGFDAAAVTAMVGDGAAALVDRAMAARGRARSADDLDGFLEDYTANAAVGTRPYPGAAATLDRLRAQGWRIGLCTNKPEAAARALLGALGLLDRFDAIAGGDRVARRKPHPDHLTSLLHEMGSGVARAVMVGDHHNDVLAARGAGVPCIFAAWGYGTLKMAEGAAADAGDFTALPELLAGLA